MKRFAIISLLFFAVATYGAEQPQHYRVLIPVIVSDPVPGAFSSLWTTPFALHNPTDTPFYIDRCVEGMGCLAYLHSDEEILPHETQTKIPPFDLSGLSTRPARILWIRTETGVAADPASLSFQLRSADVSRSATNAGTEIPVVRETQFRRTTTNLLNVPVDPRFRLTLRVYEMKLRAADFHVRLYDQASSQLLGSSTVRLEMHPASAPFEPGYLQISDLSALLPAGTTLPEHFRIEIEPATANSEFWAFVSITNNESQHVTLVTPQ